MTNKYEENDNICEDCQNKEVCEKWDWEEEDPSFECLKDIEDQVYDDEGEE